MPDPHLPTNPTKVNLREVDREYARGAIEITNTILTRGEYDSEVLKVIRRNEATLKQSLATMREAGATPDGLISRLEDKKLFIKRKKRIPKTPQLDNLENFVPLGKLMRSLGVPKVDIPKAIDCISTTLLNTPEDPLKGNYLARGMGYGINPTDEVKSIIEPKLRERKLIQERSVEEIVREAQKETGFVSLTRLASEMGIHPGRLRVAVTYIEGLLSKGIEELNGNYNPREKGKGYVIKSSEEVKKVLTPKLEEAGFFSQLPIKPRTKNPIYAEPTIQTTPFQLSRPQIRIDRAISVGIGKTEKVSLSSYDFRIDNLPVRISEAALNQIRSGKKLKEIEESKNLGEKLAKFLEKAVRKSTRPYTATNHEMFTYTNPNNQESMDFRLVHGVVTDITIRTKY